MGSSGFWAVTLDGLPACTTQGCSAGEERRGDEAEAKAPRSRRQRPPHRPASAPISTSGASTSSSTTAGASSPAARSATWSTRRAGSSSPPRRFPLPALKSVDAIFADAVERKAIPGVVGTAATTAATARGVVYEGAFGRRDLTTGVAMTPDTVVWIASMTKAITATAAMQLVERGKLSLDAPATAAVPERGRLARDRSRAKQCRQSADSGFRNRKDPAMDDGSPALGKVLTKPLTHAFAQHRRVEDVQSIPEGFVNEMPKMLRITLFGVKAEVLQADDDGAVGVDEETVDGRAPTRKVHERAGTCPRPSGAERHEGGPYRAFQNRATGRVPSGHCN